MTKERPRTCEEYVIRKLEETERELEATKIELARITREKLRTDELLTEIWKGIAYEEEDEDTGDGKERFYLNAWKKYDKSVFDAIVELFDVDFSKEADK